MIKAFAQKAVSLLPMRREVTAFLQTHVTRATRQLSPRFFEKKVADAHKHLEYYLAASGASQPPPRVLELGTGWYPIVPVALCLCGTSTLWTVDREDTLTKPRLLEVLRMFADYAADGRLAKLLPRIQSDRLAQLIDVLDRAGDLSKADMLSPLGIRAVIADARRLELDAGCADLVFSTLVLGFIPARVLVEIMRELRRVIAPAGVMSHFIDLADLYALFDHHITEYNFLRYTARRWNLLNNSIQYLNRLRMSDYRRLHEQAGFRIVQEDIGPGSLERLATVPLAPEFRGYAPEDLAVRSAWIVSQPLAGGSEVAQ
jgi:hypothetical protein